MPLAIENPNEHRALCRLVDTWGRGFTLKFFPDVDETALARCYYGLSVDPGELAKIKRVLIERMPHE